MRANGKLWIIFAVSVFMMSQTVMANTEKGRYRAAVCKVNADSESQIYVQGEIYENSNHAHMFPVREVCELLNYQVAWNAKDCSVTITDRTKSAKMFMDQDRYIADNETYRLNAAAEMHNGIAYVPSLFFSKFFYVTMTNEENELIKIYPYEPTVLGEFSKIKEGNWGNFTKEQKQQDFDYLYKTLQENYPYFPMIKRMYDVDMAEEYAKIREEVLASNTDAEFFAILDSFTRQANMTGHLSTVAPIDYPWYTEEWDMSVITPGERAGIEKIQKAYKNEKSMKNYEEMGKVFWPVFDEVQDYYGNLAKINQMSAVVDEYENVKTVLLNPLEPGEIAYIGIKSFDMNEYKKDKQTLFDFYEEVKDYENVIFDFTENSGGSMSYFNDLIVAPNIEEALSMNVYYLAKNGEINRNYYNFSNWSPASQLSKLPNMNKEDLLGLHFMEKVTYQVKPLQREKMLKGKIWILVSRKGYSSSEYAAMFAKKTGFAMLVGRQTGGDGIGEEPLPIVLPNSGIIVRYSPIYVVTSDGTSSQEFGTTPQFQSEKGESPLDTCLKVIRQQEDSLGKR